MPSPEVLEAVHEILSEGLKHDDGLIGMPAHMTMGNPAVTGQDRFLSREAFAYVDRMGWARQSRSGNVWYLTDDGKQVALRMAKL